MCFENGQIWSSHTHHTSVHINLVNSGSAVVGIRIRLTVATAAKKPGLALFDCSARADRGKGDGGNES